MNHVPPNRLLASTQCRAARGGDRLVLDQPSSLDPALKTLLIVGAMVLASVLLTMIFTSCSPTHDYLQLP